MGRFAQFYFKVVRNKKSFELSRFRMNSTSGIGVGKYLKAFEKSNTQHDLDFDNFSLECSYGYGYGRFYRVYSDAQYTLTLTYQGGEYDENLNAVASIGFEVGGPSTIIVKQIQGVSGKDSILKHLKWERMLLTILMDWAKNAGFKTVKIIQAKSSHWYSSARHDSLFMKYDVTARRSGFKFNQADETYVRSLV